VGVSAGRLARPDDVDDLARAAREAVALDRAAVRDHAVRLCSVHRMVTRYEELYARASSPTRPAEAS
ncbi:hypothetical protein, partial [Aeromicrobium sp. CnD17-E]|nr:hypothetical protein [Aeromicrobium sp. CnD17-E]